MLESYYLKTIFILSNTSYYWLIASFLTLFTNRIAQASVLNLSGGINVLKEHHSK
jgi:hypothetical protein